MFLHKVDDNGLFIEDCILDSIPNLIETVTATDEDGNVTTEIVPVLDADGNTAPDTHYIETPCPDGFYLPKWDGTQWIEGGTAPIPTATEPTLEERTKVNEDAILALMGVVYGV